MTYAPEHEKELLLHRSNRRRMGASGAACSASQHARGRPKTHGSRQILNAIFFYVLKSGCAWQLLPRDFPPWETVYWWFRRWRIDGTFERLNDAAVRERLRVRLRRNPQPSAGVVVDSQSAKTTGVGGEARGYDGVGRRFAAGSAISSWWTRKAWFSRSRSTVPRSPIRTGSNCC
jgi:transposase